MEDSPEKYIIQAHLHSVCNLELLTANTHQVCNIFLGYKHNWPRQHHPFENVLQIKTKNIVNIVKPW